MRTSSSMMTGSAPTGSSTPPIWLGAEMWQFLPTWGQLPTRACESIVLGKRGERFQHAADLAGGGDVAVFADLGATAHQGVRIDHGAVVDVSADIDVHRRHAGHGL